MSVRKKLFLGDGNCWEALRVVGPCGVKRFALAACMAMAFCFFGAANANAAAPAATINCTNGHTPNMTVEIYNNSTSHNIYPVLFAGAPSVTDTWMQACFQLTDGQLAANPYPRATQYRMYINCCASGENGIPPGGSVRITLPLYSPLVGTIKPTQSGQLIDWWQGGGINFYKGPSSATTPPTVLQQHWNGDQNGNEVTPTIIRPLAAAAANCISSKRPLPFPITIRSSWPNTR